MASVEIVWPWAEVRFTPSPDAVFITLARVVEAVEPGVVKE